MESTAVVSHTHTLCHNTQNRQTNCTLSRFLSRSDQYEHTQIHTKLDTRRSAFPYADPWGKRKPAPSLACLHFFTRSWLSHSPGNQMVVSRRPHAEAHAVRVTDSAVQLMARVLFLNSVEKLKSKKTQTEL